jgi:hypothetical protein
MTVLSTFYSKMEKNPNEPIIVIANIQGPDSYPSGGFTVKIPGVRSIINAVVVPSGGSVYGLPTVKDVKGNAVTIQVWSTTGTPMTEIASGTPLTSYVFTLIAIAY